METIDGVGTNRWKVRMVTEEKWRRKPEEREIWRPEVRPSQINHLFNVTNPPQICHFFKNKQTGHVITDWQHLIGQKNFILNPDFVDRHINYILYQLIDLQSLF